MRLEAATALPFPALLALLAATSSAQGAGPAFPPFADPPRASAPGAWEPLRFRELPASGSFATHALPEYLGLTPTDGELVAAMLRPNVPPLRREDLEGSGEDAARYHALPGGIVLGLAAHLPETLTGARIETDGAGRLVLAAPGALPVELPPLAPELLLPCLDFARSPAGSHTAVSLIDDVVRLAPELAGGRIGLLLERADRAPHGRLPTSSTTKTMIVDRDVRVETAGGRAVLRADLEVRFYAPAESALALGMTQRVGTLVLVDGPEGLRPVDATAPADVRALARDLDGVAELAAWIGLFRRAAGEDPADLRRLRDGLARELPPGVPRAGHAR